MKKILFATFAVILAAVSFTSCEDITDSMSDTELIAKIQSYATYDGKDWEGDKMYFRVVSNKYILDYEKIEVAEFDAKYDEYKKDPDNAEVFFAGTWTVNDGRLILTDFDGSTYSGVVEKEGKQIVLTTSKDAEFATLTK